MVFEKGRGEGVPRVRRTWGTRRTPGMSSPKPDRDSDRESLTGWTLVDREGTPDKKTSRAGKDDEKDSGESSASPTSIEKPKKEKKAEAEKKEKNESGCGTEEEEGEEELSEDLISMGKRVQEIKGESVKASSGSDSSDIETLDCPGPDDFYEDTTQGYSSLHSSLLSSSLSGFTFLEDADDGDVESLASSDVMVLEQEGKGPDEETDLSLASCPSLPDDLPAIKPDTQYRHTPDRDLNSRLNVVVALTLACVLGLGLGHFLGWSSRSLWQENLNSAQIIESLNLENEELRSEMTRLQQQNVSPIKISGKDGKIARDLREQITNLLEDNEELRVAVTRQQFTGLPEGDSKAFNSALSTNYKLRLSVNKLTHLVPDVTSLKVSANELQKENQDLQKQVGKLRYQEQPLPQELNAVTREVENLKKVIGEASKKKKAPPNYENAKTYLSYMTQVHQKLNTARTNFNQLKSSLASKWETIKELGRPQNLARVSEDTLGKMNRVVVNVVNKMKDIGQASIMKRGKASLESVAVTLGQSLAALGNQFDKTWNNLQAEVGADGDEFGSELLAQDEDEGLEAAGKEEEEETEDAVDNGEEAEEREGRDAGNEASEVVNFGSNEAKKEVGKSGGAGSGGKGGGGDGGRGGDDKELEGKKVNAEEKHEGKRDKARSRLSNKEEKEEQKEKKAKKKEEKAKKKKEKEDKKSKKNKKKDNGKNRDKKEDYEHKKKDDWAKKSPQEDDKRHHRKQFNNKYDKKHQRQDTDDDDDDDDDDDEEDGDDGKFKRKYHRKKQTREDDDDDDDDKNKFKRKFHKNDILEDDDDDDDDYDEDEKKKGLLRHWEKPSRKNYRREYPGPKKAFIRRRDN